jgi:NADPH:quinone reductase-like Zn-dependent oxidoreductase
VQLAREVGARVIGTGRAADRDTALGLGADAFLDLQSGQLDDAGEVDVVFDVIGGDILRRSAALVRAGGTLVTIATPPEARPRDGRAVFFVVEPDRARLADLARQLPDRRVWARWVGCCHVGSGRLVRGDGLYRRADRTSDDRERCLPGAGRP